MDSPSIIPSHDIASWLLRHIDGVLDSLGLHHYQTVEEVIYLVVISLAAFGIAWVIKRLIYVVLRKIVRMRNGVFGRELLEWHTLSKVCQIIPPLILFAMVPFAFEGTHPMRTWIFRIVGIYSMCAFGYAICAIFTFVYNHYNIHNNKKNLPLKGLLNVAKGIIWIVIGICAVATLVGKSPAYLLTGLTAFAAALMLVFKDTILGLVASVQLTANKMIRRGDWVVCESHHANGEVEDISLTTVKIRNWDNSVTTIPPYSLVSESFRNYQPMRRSGGRRVDRSVIIDANSVRFLGPDELAALREKGWLEGLDVDAARSEINLRLLRRYLTAWLAADPRVNEKLLLKVRQMEPTPSGLPLQLYFFCHEVRWKEFEEIQSDIFDHVYAIIGEFGLRVFQSPTGADIMTLAK